MYYFWGGWAYLHGKLETVHLYGFAILFLYSITAMDLHHLNALPRWIPSSLNVFTLFST